MNVHVRKAIAVCAVLAVIAVIGNTNPQPCFGQATNVTSGNQQEYIRSTTQLSNGMVVTSTSIPGQQPQTVIGYGSTTQRPAQQAYGQQTSAPSNSNPSGMQSVLEQGKLANQMRLASQQRIAQAYQSPTLAQQSTNSGIFLAPAAQQQTVFQQPALQQPPQVLPPLVPDASFNAANQIPTLGVPGNYVTPPVRLNRACCGATTALLPGITNPTGAYSPGTGYRPLIPIRNLPPGTYVGQGIIGQPKAYVDGQPVRNLFRYIFP